MKKIEFFFLHLIITMALTREILNSHPVGTLKKEVAKTNIKGYSKMKKAELVELMMKNKERFGHIQKAEGKKVVLKPPKELKKSIKPDKPKRTKEERDKRIKEIEENQKKRKAKKVASPKSIPQSPKQADPNVAIALPPPPSMKGKKAKKPRGFGGLVISNFKNTEKGAKYVLSLMGDSRRRDSYKIEVEDGGRHGKVRFYSPIDSSSPHRINLNMVGTTLQRIKKNDIESSGEGQTYKEGVSLLEIDEIRKVGDLVSGKNYLQQLNRERSQKFLVDKDPGLAGKPVYGEFMNKTHKTSPVFIINNDSVVAVWNGYVPPLYYKNHRYVEYAPMSLYVRADE
jgi:hypothetical protein